jgi:prepilin-type N-terminal cleavage/methylation domain-containing protein
MWPMVWSSKRSERGFTVIELMVVVGIVAVMTSVLAVAIRQGSESFALRRAASLAVSEIRRAQSSAIAERRDIVVEFGFGTTASVTTYRFTDADVWEQVRSIRAPARGLDGDWPAAVTFLTSGSTLGPCGGASLPGASGNKCLKFGLFGEPTSPAGAGQVVLRNRAGTQLRVVVTPATGQVTVLR